MGIWEVKERIATLKYLIFPFSFYFSMFILYLGNLSFFYVFGKYFCLVTG
ncbi:hypothetical protein HMPREF2531_03572 [Bacteroides intestinalis]|uniref:Uncharacterized protein n=1 Tax=Bacteroides intestinalis TaxID=329854 RepID=A0A139L1U6_9BACE|nr:hypothetical protein HMPREF2531_03572 [Bacteroides intestinalis]